MTVRELLIKSADALARAGVPDARLDAEYLLAEVLNVPRLTFPLCGQNEVPPEAEKAFLALLRRRENREPLQYILGTQDFYGLTFSVSPDVLIPRADTETLCEKALETLPLHEAREALDLCTGSGALGAAIAQLRPRTRVSASDLSEDALQVARANAKALGVQVSFYQGDLFAPFSEKTFDLIVSNPPYIPRCELDILQKEVRFEPSMALDGGVDGLDFYRRIAVEAPGHMKPGAYLCLETGDGENEEVARLLREQGLTEIECFSDLDGNPRVVRARRDGHD